MSQSDKKNARIAILHSLFLKQFATPTKRNLNYGRKVVSFCKRGDSDDELDFGSDSGELLNTTGSSESDRIGRTTTHDNVETKNVLIADITARVFCL